MFGGSLPNTALIFDTPPPFFLTSPCQGGDLSSLGRLIMKKNGLSDDDDDDVAVANFPEGLLNDF